MATLVLTGGGSAGHCTPNLSLTPYLKKYFDKIYYIGSENGLEKNLVIKAGIPYFSIPCAKFKRNFSADNLLIPFKVIKGINAAGKLLGELKADVVFSKGGYVSLPVVFAAAKKKIPVVAHESDITPGLTNKLCAKKCVKVLTAFPQTAKEFKNGDYIGSPIRELKPKSSKAEIYKKYGISGKKPLLLVIGGSLGAKAVNKVVFDAKDELLKNFDVLHAVGKSDLCRAVKTKGYRAVDFIEDMGDVLSVTSVAVSRGGANSLFELISLSVPSVIIPLPKDASRGDQIKNAEYFAKKGVIFHLPQKELTADSLVLSVNAAFNSKSEFRENILKAGVKDKSKEIAKIIADCVKR